MSTNRAVTATEVAALLRQHRIRPTRQRVLLGEILFACDQHVTPAELLQQVQRGGDLVARGTVYNSLELFAQKGLVRVLDMGERGRVYDTNLKAHHHVHHVESGKIEDLDSEQIKVDVPDHVLGRSTVVGVDVTVRVSG